MKKYIAPSIEEIRLTSQEVIADDHVDGSITGGTGRPEPPPRP